MKAMWNNEIIAESDDVLFFDNNQYFPPDSLKKDFFKQASNTTVCSWKGTANYFDVVVKGKINEGAAWYYANPSQAAEQIKGRIAFWKGVILSK
ncbi:DUF427 domain-containing protein [Silvanigrella aquatica]|uniref:DUF427 domain-containing protein n=1 Tax=Silvanigrella aquatica TaxID=1915309 RepID=A0A1L4D0C3_9BACT|nr:DUF427 domain-containing protein [Silvanigrella aquatica]APJ03662.1 hypothetical protein AXG55_06975 [Silvanigrella aquatica]